MGKNPLLSLICVYNDQSQFEELVNSLGNMRENVEIVGLDNRQAQWKSAASAYLEGISRASSQILVFSHQDIRFTDDSFLTELISELTCDPLQIIGVAGAVPVDSGHGRRMLSGMYQGSKLMRHHTASSKTAVMSLDECLFAFGSKVLDRVTFDDVTCDSWHFYAVDLCLQAHLCSIPVYVVPANVLHLSGGNRDASYYLAQEKLKSKYMADYDCIATTCGWTSTSYVDPYRPIIDDELGALHSKGVKDVVRFYLPVSKSLSMSNMLFFPSVETLLSITALESTDEDEGFFSALTKMDATDRRLLEFVIELNNFVASQNWLLNDLLDLKRDYAESTKDELLSSTRYRIGHILAPWSRPKYMALCVEPMTSKAGSLSFTDGAVDDLPLLSHSPNDIIEAIRLYAESYNRSSLGVVGKKCLDILGLWQGEVAEIKKLQDKNKRLAEIDHEALYVKKGIEATLAFRLGSALSRLVGR